MPEITTELNLMEQPGVHAKRILPFADVFDVPFYAESGIQQFKRIPAIDVDHEAVGFSHLGVTVVNISRRIRVQKRESRQIPGNAHTRQIFEVHRIRVPS